MNLRSDTVPLALRGPIGCNGHQVPRFWLTFWADGLRAHLSLATNSCAIAAIDRLYETANDLGIDLDLALTRTDMMKLEVALGAHFRRLNNRARQHRINVSRTWQNCVSFVGKILDWIGAADEGAWEDICAKLHHLGETHGSLKAYRTREPAPIRALASVVVTELYEIFDPLGASNPFRSQREKVRNYLIFILLLHLGLRRGEILILGVDAFYSEFDTTAGHEIFWLVIDYVGVAEKYEQSDPRTNPPSLKNNRARRMLPISLDIYMAVDVYLAGYRKATKWPHLLTSQKGRPLSPRRLNEIFEIATSRLSAAAKAALKSRGKAEVEPHDLRHTAAVRRLAGYREGGISHSEAVEKLRAFFGWHEDSPMPARYARAYYETDYDTVWQDNYDSYVDAIRRVEVGS